MSKKTKKQQPNGFLLFMRDMQQDMRERGRNVSMRDMPVLAGPKWAKLSDPEKATYNARAKAERRGSGASPRGAGLMYIPPPPGRMDSAGELLSVSVHERSCEGGREVGERGTSGACTRCVHLVACAVCSGVLYACISRHLGKYSMCACSSLTRQFVFL